MITQPVITTFKGFMVDLGKFLCIGQYLYGEVKSPIRTELEHCTSIERQSNLTPSAMKDWANFSACNELTYGAAVFWSKLAVISILQAKNLPLAIADVTNMEQTYKNTAKYFFGGTWYAYMNFSEFTRCNEQLNESSSLWSPRLSRLLSNFTEYYNKSGITFTRKLALLGDVETFYAHTLGKRNKGGYGFAHYCTLFKIEIYHE